MNFKYLFALSLGVCLSISTVVAQSYEEDEEIDLVDSFGNDYSKFSYQEGDLDDLKEFGIENEDVSQYNPYRKIYANDFKYRWSVQVGAGVQTIFGADDHKAKFANRLTLSPNLAIGYRFTNKFGLKIAFSGGTLHGFNDGVSGTYRFWKKKDDAFKEEFIRETFGADMIPTYMPIINRWDPMWTYWGLGADNVGSVGSDSEIYHTTTVPGFAWAKGFNNEDLYMRSTRYFAADLSLSMNLTNLIFDSGDERPFDASFYAGPTVFHTLAHQNSLAYTGLAFNTGLEMLFHLNKNLAVYTDFKIQWMPDGFNGQYGGHPFQPVTHANLGLMYKFTIQEFQVLSGVPQQPEGLDPYLEDLRLSLLDEINSIEDLQPEIDKIRAQLEELSRPKARPVEMKSFFLPDVIHFTIGKYDLNNSATSIISSVATYLRNNPEASVIVTGFADRNTGNATINERLSRERSKAVADALSVNYGISRNRIAIDWRGDELQPFEQNDLNRAVLFYIDYED